MLDRLLLRKYDAQALGHRFASDIPPMVLRRIRADKVARDLGQPRAAERLMYLLLLRERDPHVLREDPKP